MSIIKPISNSKAASLRIFQSSSFFLADKIFLVSRAISSGTLNVISGHFPAIFWQKSFSRLAVFTISKPTSPPKVDGFPVIGSKINSCF